MGHDRIGREQKDRNKQRRAELVRIRKETAELGRKLRYLPNSLAAEADPIVRPARSRAGEEGWGSFRRWSKTDLFTAADFVAGVSSAEKTRRAFPS